MYGLVLEGGGAKGAYQIGAFKALQELGLEIGAVAGTSVGALNGAMIVQGDIEKAYEMWQNISPSKVIEIDELRLKELKARHLKTGNLSYYFKRLREILGDGGLDVSPLRNLLVENIDEEKLRQSPMDLGIVTVSLSDMKPLELFIEDIPTGQLVDYLMASSGLPVFKQEPLGGKRFIDGGFHDNLPVNLLVSKGYTDIIAIRTFGPGRHQKINNRDLKIQYISPVDDLGGVLHFDGDMARRNLKLGYYDALRVFRGLQGKHYYLTPDKEEDFFLQVLTAWPEKSVLSIGEIMGCHSLPCKRMLFEQIIPRLIEMLKMERKANYAELSVLLLEELASRYQVERFKVYSLEEFLAEIKKQYISQQGVTGSGVPVLHKRNRLIPQFASEEVFAEIAYHIFEEIL